MVLELSALIAAVEAVSLLVKGTVPVVRAIRSGVMARNEEAKRQLMQSLEQLQQNLQHAGELAQVAEGYFQTLENVLELRSLCGRTEGFLKDNLNECRNSDSANYAGNWRVLEAMFQTIDSNRDAPRKVVLARAEWYDERDRDQIGLLLQQFTAAYERAAAHARNKIADDLLYELRGMISPLQDSETLLRNTVYDKILRTLQKLGP